MRRTVGRLAEEKLSQEASNGNESDMDWEIASHLSDEEVDSSDHTQLEILQNKPLYEAAT